MAGFLDEKHKEIQARLKELKPLVDEYRELEAADKALSGLGRSAATSSSSAGASAAAPAARRSTRRTSTRRAKSGGARRGRPRGSGTRAAQALDLVRDRPGITIPEMAQAMGIQQNYLYRVLPGLAEEGKVVKSGRGWHLREGAAS
jgi:mevalonate pyrophosphate decarboxylase